MSDLSASKETAKRAGYIVGSSDSYKYQTVTLLVTNAQPGMPITIAIAPKNNADSIAWSTGSPSDSSSGMNMQVTSGTLPLTGFQITTSLASFSTAPGGGSAVSFNFNAFLCADLDLGEFFATLQSAPTGAVVKLQLQGQNPLVVNTSRTPFDWGSNSRTVQ